MKGSLKLQKRQTTTNSVSFVEDWLSSQSLAELKRSLDVGEVDSCYQHPYGFKVARMSISPFVGWNARIHIWPSLNDYESGLRESGAFGQEIHAHGWEVLSKVLVGGIREQVYEKIPGSGFVYSVFSSLAAGESCLSRKGCGIGMSEVEAYDRLRDSGVCRIPAGVFHSSKPLNGPVVTIVATSDSEGKESQVWTAADHGVDYENVRSPLAAEDFIEGFDRVLLGLRDNA